MAHNRDAHWFLAMFDSLRPFRDTSEELDRWFHARSFEALEFDDDSVAPQCYDDETNARLVNDLRPADAHRHTLRATVSAMVPDGEVVQLPPPTPLQEQKYPVTWSYIESS